MSIRIQAAVFTMILGVTMIDGKWAILSKFIQGKTMSRLMKENPDNKSNYLI